MPTSSFTERDRTASVSTMSRRTGSAKTANVFTRGYITLWLLSSQHSRQSSEAKAAVVFGPGDVVNRHQSTGDERVATEEHGDGGFGRGLREAPQKGLLDHFPGEQIALEAVFTRRFDTEVCFDYSRIDDGAVAEFGQPQEETLGTDLLEEKAEQTARLVAGRGGREAAFLGEEPHAA